MATATAKKRRAPGSPLTRLQHRHVLWCNIMPLVGTVIAIGLAFVYPPRLGEFVCLGVMWFIMGIGVTVGYHRYFTHQAFETSYPMRIALAIMGSLAAQGPIIVWVALHRRHHQLSDREGDPHSPNLCGDGWINKLKGVVHAHCGWILEHDVPNPTRYAADLLGNAGLRVVNDCYYSIVFLSVVLPGAALWVIRSGDIFAFVSGCLWGGAIRIAIGSQFIWAVNSVCHAWGSRPYATPDMSRNNALFCLPTAGEAWHCNHHAFPKSAALGHHWWQVDLGFLVVRCLQLFGLVWDVWTPRRIIANREKL